MSFLPFMSFHCGILNRISIGASKIVGRAHVDQIQLEHRLSITGEFIWIGGKPLPVFTCVNSHYYHCLITTTDCETEEMKELWLIQIRQFPNTCRRRKNMN